MPRTRLPFPYHPSHPSRSNIVPPPRVPGRLSFSNALGPAPLRASCMPPPCGGLGPPLAELPRFIAQLEVARLPPKAGIRDGPARPSRPASCCCQGTGCGVRGGGGSSSDCGGSGSDWGGGGCRCWRARREELVRGLERRALSCCGRCSVLRGGSRLWTRGLALDHVEVRLGGGVGRPDLLPGRASAPAGLPAPAPERSAKPSCMLRASA